MELLKKLFPFSFKKSEDVANLVISIIIYAVIGLVAGAIIGVSPMLVNWIPVVGAILGWVLGIIGSIVDLYIVAGIVLKILVYTKVIKD